MGHYYLPKSQHLGFTHLLSVLQMVGSYSQDSQQFDLSFIQYYSFPFILH